MTYKIIKRGAPRPILCEFRCPTHGLFEAVVDSDTDEAPCPHAPVSYSVGPVAGVEGPRQYFVDACGLPSPWSPSKCPPMRMKRVEATRGQHEKAEHKGWLDTTNLEEGQSFDDWQDDRNVVHEQLRQELVMQALKDDR